MLPLSSARVPRLATLALAALTVAGGGAARPRPAGAQEAPAAAPAAQPPAAQGTLNLFIDCNHFRCDSDFFRTEMSYVNHVRDRFLADVHVLVTTLTTGGGGTEFTVAFMGVSDRFRGLQDTLRHVATQLDTPDDVRKGLVRTFQQGLVRYAARTPLAQRLTVTYATPRGSAPTAAQPADDPWNFWVFRINTNGFAFEERQVKDRSVSGSVSASRITALWKVEFTGRVSYNQNRFDLGNGDVVANIQRNNALNSLVGYGLSPHWSVGVRSQASSSNFVNQQLHARVKPVVEYSLWPYAQATRKQLRLQYGVGVDRFDYIEPTIFGRTTETMPVQQLSASMDVRQPWGSVSGGSDLTSYLNEPSRNRTNVFAGGNLRIVKGLFLNAFANYSRIRDQFYLPRGGATEEQILIRQRQLATGYRFNANFGLSYVFGSAYNNVVNPRFGGSGGQTFFVF